MCFGPKPLDIGEWWVSPHYLNYRANICTINIVTMCNWDGTSAFTWDLSVSLSFSSDPARHLTSGLTLSLSLSHTRTHRHTISVHSRRRTPFHIRANPTECQGSNHGFGVVLKNPRCASALLCGSARCTVRADPSDQRVLLDWPAAAGEDWCVSPRTKDPPEIKETRQERIKEWKENEELLSHNRIWCFNIW